MVEGVHKLFNSSRVVPPMNIEDVDVIRAKLLERVLDRDVQGLGVVPQKLRLLRNFLEARAALVVRRELRYLSRYASSGAECEHTFVAMTI